MKRPLVVGMGQAMVAVVGRVPRLAGPDNQLELDEVSVQVGGATTIATATVVSLGCAARLCIPVADDFLAPFVVGALRETPIDLRVLQNLETDLTAFSFDVVGSDPPTRTGYWTTGDVGRVEPADLDIGELLENASALVVDGYFPAAQIALAEAARKRDVPVLFDGCAMAEGVGELAALADVFICSERLAAELAPRGEARDSLVELQQLGPRAVILTLGETGAIGLHGNQLVEQGAFPVDVVDPSAAGDVYLGAFVTALLSRMPFAACMEFASAAAALSCTKIGPWSGIPVRQNVLELIRTTD